MITRALPQVVTAGLVLSLSLSTQAAEPFEFPVSPEDVPKFNKPIAIYSNGQLTPYLGTYSTGMSIALPPARAGLVPRLEVTYATDAQPSLLGLGWRVTESYVRRSLKKGVPRYVGPGQGDNEDPLEYAISEHSGPLVYIKETAPGSGIYLYRPKREGSFFKFYYHSSVNYWIVLDQQGRQWVLGDNDAKDQDNGKVFAWHVKRIIDADGNLIEYSYAQSGGTLYPIQIRYDLHVTSTISHPRFVHFVWNATPTPRQLSYRKGYRSLFDALQLVQLIVGAPDPVSGTPVSTRDYGFTYSTESPTSFHQNITRIEAAQLPATTFTYNGPVTGFDQAGVISDPDLTSSSDDQYNLEVVRKKNINPPDPTYYDLRTTSLLVDMDGDGDLDKLDIRAPQDDPSSPYSTAKWFWVENAAGQWTGGYKEIPPPPFGPCPVCNKEAIRFEHHANGYPSITSRYVDLVDLNGDSYPDYIFIEAGALYVCPGNGCKASTCFDACTQWTVPSIMLTSSLARTLEVLFGSYDEAGLVDINGDGLPDYIDAKTIDPDEAAVYLNTGSGFSTTVSYTIHLGFCGELGAEGMHTSCIRSADTVSVGGDFVKRDLRDVNGDGLVDLVVKATESYPMQIAWGTGTGFDWVNGWSFAQGCIGGRSGMQYPDHATMNEDCGLYDVNGDGLLDVFGYYQGYRTYLNNGAGFDGLATWPVPAASCAFSHLSVRERVSTGGWGSHAYILLRQAVLDFDGDGQVELVTGYDMQRLNSYNNGLPVGTNDSPWCRRGTLGQAVHGLQQVTSGNGMHTEVVYGRPQQEDLEVPYPLHPVEAVSTNDTNTGQTRNTYMESHGGKYDAASREFRGYQKVVEDQGNLRTVTHYYHQGEYDRGSKWKEVVADSSGNDIQKTETSYAVVQFDPAVERRWARPTSTKTTIYDPGGTREVLEEYTYWDSGGTCSEIKHLGLTKSIVQKGDPDDNQDDRTTEFTYVCNESDWPTQKYIVGREQETLKDVAGSTVAQSKLTYDNRCTNPSVPEIERGHVCQESVWRDTGVADAEHHYEYDSFGRLIKHRDPDQAPTEFSSFTYLGDSGYRSSEQNALGHTVWYTYKDSAGTYQNGYLFDLPYSICGPEYTSIPQQDKCDAILRDKYGRPTEEHKAILTLGGSSRWTRKKVREITYLDQAAAGSPPHVIARTYPDADSSPGTYREEHVYYDGSGRVLKHGRIRNATNTFAQYFRYDFFGNVHDAWIPVDQPGSGYSPPAGQGDYVYSHDLLNRPVEIRNPDLEITSAAYRGDQVTVNDARNRNSVNTLSAFGKLTRTEKTVGGIAEVTQYQYDAADRLRQVTDGEGQVYTMSYFGDSTLKRATAPSGGWTYYHTPAGRLETVVADNGATESMDRDSIGRITRRSVIDSGPAPAAARSSRPSCTTPPRKRSVIWTRSLLPNTK